MELLLGFNMEVLHNGCNTYTRVLPDMHTLIPWACGPRDSGVHIRKNIRVHVTTINCTISVITR